MDYTIPNLFLSAFGLKIEKMYAPQIGSNLPQEPGDLYSGIEVITSLQEAVKISHLGTPILFPITFLAGTYKAYDKVTGAIEDVVMEEFQLPTACVASFRRRKIMNTTRMSGGYGTVKEIYGFDDYQININGFFIPDPGQPQGKISVLEQENELNKWDGLASSIKVSSELFNLREIPAIVMEEFNVVPERGKPNIRPFSIRAISDEPTEIFEIL